MPQVLFLKSELLFYVVKVFKRRAVVKLVTVLKKMLNDEAERAGHWVWPYQGRRGNGHRHRGTKLSGTSTRVANAL